MFFGFLFNFRHLSHSAILSASSHLDIYVALLKPDTEAQDLLPLAAADFANEECYDGIGAPAALLVDRWRGRNHHVTVVALAASCAAMWARQLVQIHLDLRAIKVHDIPMGSTSNDCDTRHYAVTVGQL